MSERFEKNPQPEEEPKSEENKGDIDASKRAFLKKAALIVGGAAAAGAALKYVEELGSNMKKFQFENAGGERSFSEQFQNREKIETEGGTVETLDINPNAEGTPFLMAPAWGCTMNVYEPAIETLSEGGGWDNEDALEVKEDEPKEKNRVLSLDYPRFGGSAISPQEAVQKYPKVEIIKAETLLGVLEKKGVKKINAIAHSEAAINVVLAALINPEKFESITLFAPAGLMGEDNFTRLLTGFVGQFKGRPESMSTIPITGTEKEVQAVAGKEALKYFLKNPVRLLQEGTAIYNSQIHEALRYLHEKGVSICVIAPVDDPVFPMKDIQKIVKADMLDGFLSVRGGHGAIGEHPELYIEAIKGLVKSMKKKREKKNQPDNSGIS